MTKTANNNYGADWSYAGADADTFDRADVAGPAQDLDEHDHSSGKGLPAQRLHASQAAGDQFYATAAGVLGRLAIGTARQILTVNDGATAPQWTTLSTASNELSGDVTITNAGTFYAGPSVSLTAGTWLVIGTLTIGGNAVVAVCEARLSTLNGGIIYGSAAGSHPADATVRAAMTVSGIVTLTETTTIYIYGTSSSAGEIMDAAYYGAQTCHLRAMRFA